MAFDPLFPLRGKNSVIRHVSIADAYIEVDPSFDQETAIKLFKEDLSQNLRLYGIEVLDGGTSLQHQDIILAIQFIVIIQNATSAQLLGFGFLNEMEAMDLQSNPPAALAAGLTVGPIIEVKGKILADETELPEASAKARLSSFFSFDGSSGLLSKCLAQAAEMLSSQINVALINYYRENTAPVEGIAERSLAGDSDWKPVLGLFLIFLICAGIGAFFYHKTIDTRKAAALATATPLSAKEFFQKGVEAQAPEEKIYYYSKAIELQPDYAVIYNYRGVVYNRKGAYDLAIKDFTMVIELNPDYFKAYFNRGIAYYHKKDYEPALKDYNKALALDPNDALSYYCRALLYKRTGNLEKARQDYDKAKSLDPKVPNIKLD